MKMELFGLDSEGGCLPLVLLNADEDISRIYELCRYSGAPEFILAAIGGFDWNRDLSPWRCDPVFSGGEPFSGEADRYLSEIVHSLLPEIEAELLKVNKRVSYRVLAGYSLAGLFALYSAFNCDLFAGIVSASGSLWYPDFPEYVSEHRLSDNVRKIYLSLGDKEGNTRNPLMKTVDHNTKRIREILSERTDVFFEYNEGGHFKDPGLRTAKGISRILKI